jgi:hypothetical protein
MKCPPPPHPKTRKTKQYKTRDSLNITTWMNKKNEQQSFFYLLHYFEMFDGLGNMCIFWGVPK